MWTCSARWTAARRCGQRQTYTVSTDLNQLNLKLLSVVIGQPTTMVAPSSCFVYMGSSLSPIAAQRITFPSPSGSPMPTRKSPRWSMSYPRATCSSSPPTRSTSPANATQNTPHSGAGSPTYVQSLPPHPRPRGIIQTIKSINGCHR